MTASTLTAAESDVVWAAYAAAVGIPEHAVPVDRVAGCARCGLVTTVMTAVGQVISRRFTGFESWTNLAGRHPGQVCVWVYRNRPLRSEAHIVGIPRLWLWRTQSCYTRRCRPPFPGIRRYRPAAPGSQTPAARCPLGADHGRRSHLNWSESDTVRLAAMRRLRDLGFTETMLRDEVPVYAVSHRLAADQWPQVFDD